MKFYPKAYISIGSIAVNLLINGSNSVPALASVIKDYDVVVSAYNAGWTNLGTDYPVFNEEGRSILSGEDAAVIIADEIEAPKHHKKRFTAVY